MKKGKTQPKKEPLATNSSSKFLVAVIVIAVIVEAVVLLEFPPSSKELLASTVRDAFEFERPLILLYAGRESGKEWHTATWAQWGNQKSNLGEYSVTLPLPWQAEGTTVTKHCDVSCFISRDQSLLPFADAVVMEIINYKKSYGDVPVKYPRRGKDGNGNDQLWGYFYYEPTKHYQSFLDRVKRDNQFQFSMSADQNSDLPVTLICPWGKPPAKYLSPPPQKSYEICDFTGYIPGEWTQFFNQFRGNLTTTVHSYGGPFSNREIPQPYNLPQRMKQISSYKFTIIVESVIEENWVGPEYSQAILSGTVPIYLGAPNIKDYLPGEHSIISVADFASPEELAKRIQFLLDNEQEYMKYFEWKQRGLSPTFQTHLDNCVHTAECRICHHVLNHQNGSN